MLPQTFGANFESDGRLQGAENIETVNCDQANNVCSIKVPAPGAALVFLTDSALSEVEEGKATTYPTTAQTKMYNTATIDPAVLATSNGHSGMGQKGKSLGSTSKGSVSGSANAGIGAWASVVLSACLVPFTMGIAMVASFY